MENPRNRISLNGLWDYSIPDGSPEKRFVPGSYSVCGDNIYTTRFPYEKKSGKTVRLCFEGIAYEGTVVLNGTELGVMLPYSFYDYDVTSLLGDMNTLTVYLKDINAPYGPTEGWKSYSGIIRPVYLEETAASYFTDVFFHAELCQEFTAAHCHVDFNVENAEAEMTVSAILSKSGHTEAVSPKVPVADGTLSFDFERPDLWSPDTPNLYELTVTLHKGNETVDIHTDDVGFKELIADGNRFLLNGEDLFITGVCRHDLWTDECGFTMTDEMIEQDLKMIKHMGANFVRLVHYPHDRRVCRMAGKIGLLVSEEPGLWWNDLENTEITTRALEVLRRVIKRDRSQVAVAFWLSFNECVFKEDFMKESVRVAHEGDPTRLISGASCSGAEETKRMYDIVGMDFYTMHPYGTHPTHVNGQSLWHCAEIMTGKPLVFTEWGGYYVVDNPNLFREFAETMWDIHNNPQPGPCLAGMSYWQWQDIHEAQRGLPACHGGILDEGIVTMDRKPKACFYTFRDFIDKIRRPNIDEPYELIVTGAGLPGDAYQTIRLPEQDPKYFEEAREASKAAPIYVHKKERHITNGPCLKAPLCNLGALEVYLKEGKPVTVSVASGTYEIPVNSPAKAVWFIGQATMGKGYPLSGIRGEEFGSYTLHFADGAKKVIPLRNGLETATVFGLIGPTNFEPRCAFASRAFKVAFDKNWEEYYTALIRKNTENDAVLEKISVNVTNPDYFLLLYGVTLEK